MNDFIPRTHSSRRLEPEGVILHGAGQSPDAFTAYRKAVSPHTPCLYMAYADLRRTNFATWFAWLRAELERGGLGLMPQIGLSMTMDGQPENHYEHETAEGADDAAIAAFCRGLAELGCPAYVRVGFEFSGHWNGYQSGSYQRAWVRIARAVREHGLEKVALVWCYSPDSRDKDFIAYYPGDEWVDWWGIDLFALAHFSAPDTLAFMRAAAERGFPVMIGESTPRRVGVGGGETSWAAWFTPYFDFMRAHAHLKAFCYINWDWAAYPQYADWGDGRVETNPAVLACLRAELALPVYRHAQAGAGAQNRDIIKANGGFQRVKDA